MVATYTRSDPLPTEGVAYGGPSSVTALADGGFVVVYQAAASWETINTPEIYVQRYDAAGNPVGAAVVLDAPSSQPLPEVTTLSDGGYIVTWTDNVVQYQRFDAAGALSGGQVAISDPDSNAGRSVTTALADGGFVIAWSEGYSPRVMHVQRYDSNGQEVNAEATYPGGSDLATLVGIVSYDGGVAIVRENSSGLYMQRVDDDGHTVGSETAIATGIGYPYYNKAAVANLNDGGFLVAWVSDPGGGAGSNLTTQRYDVHGVAVGSAVIIGAAGYQGTAVSGTADGGYVISYSYGNGIQLRYFDATGTQVGGPQMLDLDTDRDLYPDIAVLTGGGFVVTSTSYTIQNEWDVYSYMNIRGFYPDGTISDAEAGGHSLNGGLGSDTINGLDGNDTLSGGDGPGADWLYGGDGNDVLVLRHNDIAYGGDGDDVIRLESGSNFTVFGGAGRDIVDATESTTRVNAIAGESYSVEEIRGSAFGDLLSAGNSSFGVVITAGDGNDELYGGLGADTLTGGAGDDTYVANAADTIVELAGGGIDTIRTNVTFSLAAYAEIENLTILSSGAAGYIATGNGRDNLIQTGNSADLIDGGLGADTMWGGAGADTYVVDTAGDMVAEDAYGDVDQVNAGISYTLGANVENLSLTGSGDIDGTGNGLNNVLRGNSGINVLTGLGGDDSYFVGVGDMAVEAADGGRDTIHADFSYVLGAEFENLVLIGNGSVNGTGNAAANQLTGNFGNNVLTGLGGDDTYFIGGSDVVVEAVGEGIDTISVGFNYSLGANVENLSLTGIGNITGTGNGLNNVLTGNIATNVLTGLGGDDTYIVGAGDTVVEAVGGGTDTVISSLTFTLGANVENLNGEGTAAINLTGNELNNRIVGNGAGNRLYGGDGNDTLDGGLAYDVLTGGAGNDVYYFDQYGDIAVELAGGGTDIVYCAQSLVLGDNIERGVLIGAGAFGAYGNALDNLLTGNSYNNVLNGYGGADVLIGGGGNDTFTVDNAGDIVREAANEGTDLVQSGVSFSLGTQYIENLTLLGTAHTTATGNSLANILVGNSGNNVLNGAGGADRMYGMAGNDTYYVDNIADRTYESADGVTNAGGYEVVYASVRVVLDKFIEDLVIAGTAGLAGTGNELNNRMTGNAAGNALLGKGGNDVMDGGAGADTMAGGLGDDTFYIDNVLDQAVELSAQGNDTVYSSVTFNAGNQYLETITLTGTDDILLSGNAINQILTGNAGANRISGLEGDDILNGGAGNDGLSGGLGADLFIFSLGSGVDRIDFKANDNDLIDIHAYAGGVVNGGGVTISQSGAHAVIDLGGGNMIVVLNTTATDPGLLSHIVW